MKTALTDFTNTFQSFLFFWDDKTAVNRDGFFSLIELQFFSVDRPTSDHQDHDGGAGRRHSPRSSLPGCSQASKLPVPLGRHVRRPESHSSSSSSLVDVEPPENRSSKASGAPRRPVAQVCSSDVHSCSKWLKNVVHVGEFSVNQ